MSAAVVVLADHGSLSVSLMFGAPVATMLVALLVITVRDRRRQR